MPNTVKNVAIHDLRKNGTAFDVVLGQGALAISPTVTRVVRELHSLYANRASKSHGKFSSDVDNFPAQKHLADYLNGGGLNFDELTKKLMDTLALQARRKPGAAGGHVFFAHFERDASDYLMVAIINDRLGAALTTAFDVEDIKHLDLEGFRFAGRIDLTGWKASADRYIGFLRGKGDVAEYFKEFLGCDTTAQDRADTAALVRTLRAFADAQKMEGEAKDRFLLQAFGICDRYRRERLPIDFDAFANELHPTKPDELKQALGNPDLKLGDGFIPDRRALGPLIKFKAKTADWSVEFNREAITSGKIRYNKEDETITITELPAELIAELNAESAD